MVGIKPIIFRTIARIHGLNLTPRTQERISKYLPEGILTAEGKIAGHFLPLNQLRYARLLGLPVFS